MMGADPVPCDLVCSVGTGIPISTQMAADLGRGIGLFDRVGGMSENANVRK